MSTPIVPNDTLIAALYVAAFNRAPDIDGLHYWENQFAVNPITDLTDWQEVFTINQLLVNSTHSSDQLSICTTNLPLCVGFSG